MSVRYRKSPLVEAVFEFIPEGAALPLAGRDLVREALVTEFSGKQDELRTMAVEFNIPKGEVRRKASESPVRYRYWNSENTRLFQIADDMCAFNALPPYTHYVDYLPVMERVVRTYAHQAHPSSTKVLGQRYINRILLPPGSSPGDFFTVYPVSDAVAGLGHPQFALQVVTEPVQSEGGGQVTLGLVYQGLDAGSLPTYMLDLYAQSVDNPPIPFDWDALKGWHDVAHEAVKRAFEFAITDRCRELLVREEEP